MTRTPLELVMIFLLYTLVHICRVENIRTSEHLNIRSGNRNEIAGGHLERVEYNSVG